MITAQYVTNVCLVRIMTADSNVLKQRVLAARASVKAKLKQLKSQHHKIQFAYKPLATILADTLIKHSATPTATKLKKEKSDVSANIYKRDHDESNITKKDINNVSHVNEDERSLRKQFYQNQRLKYFPKSSQNIHPPSFSTPRTNKNDDDDDDEVEEVFESDPINEAYIEDVVEPAELDLSIIPETSMVEYFNTFHPLPREYIEGRTRNTDKGVYDDNYVKQNLLTDQIMFGNSQLKFDDKNSSDFKVGGYNFPGTRGLYELIFKTNPDDRHITDEDKLYYGLLIRSTNANKINFDENGKQIGNKGKKYLSFVKSSLAMIDEHKQHTGQGMQYNNKPVEYIYFDDANELVERLRLLIASRSSGNNAHTNEINSIIEELRERKLIF